MDWPGAESPPFDDRLSFRVPPSYAHTRFLEMLLRCGECHVVEIIGVARIHQSLRVTPAMEAGLADHVWSLEEIVALINQD